jgi:RNA-binding protein with serine-rich domain 1
LKDPVRIQVTKLTRNITKDHLSEIFGTYGTVAHVEVPGGNGFSFSFRHQAFIEYESSEDASKAAKYMDGGQIDGQEVMVTLMKGAPARNCSKKRIT